MATAKDKNAKKWIHHYKHMERGIHGPYTQFSNHMNNMVEAIVITQKEQLHGQVGTKPDITEPLDLPS